MEFKKEFTKFRILQPVLPFLALPLLTVSALGQATGVAHPDRLNDVDTPQQSDHYVKPSHTPASDSTPVQANTSINEQSYPATGAVPQISDPSTGTAGGQTAAMPALIVRQPTASTYAPVQTASAQPQRRELADDDDGIVSSVAYSPHELNSGTVLKARLKESLSTETAVVGKAFSAELLADAGHSGEVLLPAGSIVHGRVTAVHGGKRIGGPASIRLQPQSVTLPDGTVYPLRATVSGIDDYSDSRVTDEGAVQLKGHPRETAAALGLATGAAAVTGAVVGGGVGAVVGAGIGAGIGTVVWLKQDQQEKLPADTTIYFSLDEPLQLNPT